jgi:hypothetical protein
MTFKRRIYSPPPSAPLKPLTRQVVYSSTSVAVPVPKTPIFRSEAYRRFVASFACMACGIEKRSQCAHSNQGRHGKAGRRQASDENTFPLCADQPTRMGCHTAHDLCLEMTKDERDELEDRYIRQMQAKALHHGWRFEKDGIKKP